MFWFPIFLLELAVTSKPVASSTPLLPSPTGQQFSARVIQPTPLVSLTPDPPSPSPALSPLALPDLSPSPSPSLSPAVSPEASPSAAVSPQPTPDMTPSPSNGPTPTAGPTATPSPTTPTPTPLPAAIIAGPSPTPIVTPKPTPTPDGAKVQAFAGLSSSLLLKGVSQNYYPTLIRLNSRSSQSAVLIAAAFIILGCSFAL